MSLKEQLFADLKESMKAKDTVRKNTVQSVRAAILQEEKDNRVILDEEQVLLVLASCIKKRKSSLPDYERSGRQDLIDELKREIEILMAYLPEQLSEDVLTDIIKETIEDIGASSLKDMGKVMAAMIPKVQGKADNQSVSQIVKQLLS
ncbi:MAG: GatB/YqeY domain-containing protein [Vallitaleaceae bacterium]|jgi:uncharacterized protein YqeY|nr:GatB/YqeY domain-containing protein [Vallitaleaceae bacterium]